MHRTTSSTNNYVGSKCQECWVWETMLWNSACKVEVDFDDEWGWFWWWCVKKVLQVIENASFLLENTLMSLVSFLIMATSAGSTKAGSIAEP